jgi:ABC-type branched-subunit amino acid transport system ATPase component
VGDEGPLVIETDDPTQRFGDVLAVDNFSLRVPSDGVFGLLGPNGSGKTTTIGMLLNLVRPASGTIRLFGAPQPGIRLADLRRISASVSTLASYAYLTGRENLRCLRRAAPLHAAVRRRRLGPLFPARRDRPHFRLRRVTRQGLFPLQPRSNPSNHSRCSSSCPNVLPTIQPITGSGL